MTEGGRRFIKDMHVHNYVHDFFVNSFGSDDISPNQLCKCTGAG